MGVRAPCRVLRKRVATKAAWSPGCGEHTCWPHSGGCPQPRIATLSPALVKRNSLWVCRLPSPFIHFNSSPPRAGHGAWQEFSLLVKEKVMAPHSSTLAWKIPWTEEPGRLQSMGSLTVGHNWATSVSLFTFMHWRRKWQPTPVFLLGESQGRGSLVGCRLWGRRVWHNWSDLAAAAAAVKVRKLP